VELQLPNRNRGAFFDPGKIMMEILTRKTNGLAAATASFLVNAPAIGSTVKEWGPSQKMRKANQFILN